MKRRIHIYIAGIGIISPLGHGLLKTKNAIMKGMKGIGTLSLFQTNHNPPMPVGEIDEQMEESSIPRTHRLALIAAREALSGAKIVPDALVIGTMTGGMLHTEGQLRQNITDPELYRYHGLGTVAEYLAENLKCKGPVLTVSTACSSGAAAIRLALEMLRTGAAKNILAGGADSLCRMVYYGFHSLNLIDPDGASPFDINRRGMSVSEGAAMLLMTTDQHFAGGVEIAGGGLSYDAWHTANPHPDGRCIFAMNAALSDAGISPYDVDYINLHGTGAPDNDLIEAKAVNILFKDKKPLMSSVKGVFGHTLAASGAINAVMSALSISECLIPANIGCTTVDPDLHLKLVLRPSGAKITTALSNTFGFGGNNAALVMRRPGKEDHSKGFSLKKLERLTVIGSACITGAGMTSETLKNLAEGKICKGTHTIGMPDKLDLKTIQHMRRLPRMALSLAYEACAALSDVPTSVFFGTGWGPLSETYDFLSQILESDERIENNKQRALNNAFSSIVHNAPAEQVAICFQATGPNLTMTAGDYSFEQALIAACFLSDTVKGSMFVIGADEYHKKFSPILNPSDQSDGGGALCLQKAEIAGVRIFPVFFENSANNPDVLSALIRRLGDPERIRRRFGAVFVGIPKKYRNDSETQLKDFLTLSGLDCPVIDYRHWIGQCASASAIAAVIAVRFLQKGKIPGVMSGGRAYHLLGKGILLLGLGAFVTAIEVTP